MSRFVLTTMRISILSVACLGICLPAQAQFRGRSMMHAPIQTQAFARSAIPNIGGFGGVGSFNPGLNFNAYRNIRGFERNYYGGSGYLPYLAAATLGGYGGYGGGYGGGYDGVATPYSSVYGSWITPAPTNDSRDYIALNQAAMSNRMMAEDLKDKRLQHRRAVFDEMRYERENTPSPEDVREEMRLQQLMRARNAPPDSEIATGGPLNTLLDSVQRIQARESVIGYAIPLDPDLLKHVNVTNTSSTKGSNEFLKLGTLPDWPTGFDNPSFTSDKKRLAEDIFDMGKSQLDGKINTAKVADARKALANMRENLFLLRFSMGSNDYIDGLTYLSKLSDTIEVLAKADGKKFIDGTYSAKGETVGDLLSYMTQKGLKFARATPGSEAYYNSLYQAMVTYELGLNRLVGKK